MTEQAVQQGGVYKPEWQKSTCPKCSSAVVLAPFTYPDGTQTQMVGTVTVDRSAWPSDWIWWPHTAKRCEEARVLRDTTEEETA